MNEYIEKILSSNMEVRKKTVDEIIRNENNFQIANDLKKIVEEGPTYAKLDALTAYGRIIDKENVESLYPFLKNKSWHIRIETIRCIYYLLGEEAIDIVTPFLEDKAYGVRSEVEVIVKSFSK